LPYFFQPDLSLFFRAGDNNSEHPPVNIPDPAEGEYAVLPYRFEGVAKNVLFPFCFGVRSIEHDGNTCLE
jgi:hypothetical protein